MIKGKKILLIFHDEQSYVMYYISKRLMQDNEVFCFFCGYSETYQKKNEMNRYTYYSTLELLGKERVFTQNELLDTWKEKWKAPPIDFEFLDGIEQKYTHFKNLRLQLLCGQDASRNFHDREVFNYSTFEQDCFLMELTYRCCLKMIEHVSPDYIFDDEDDTMARAVINEIAYKREVPYISIAYSRYDGYVIPTFCLGNKIDNYFLDRYKSYVKGIRTAEEGKKRLVEYRAKKNIVEKKYIGTSTTQNKPYNKLELLKLIYGISVYCFQNGIATRGHSRGFEKSVLFSSNYWNYWKWRMKILFRRQKLFKKNRYFQTPSHKESFVYMPLHLIPESTTFVHAPYWIDELALIKNISKSLPIGWKLYVKEHPAMVGERNLDFYNDIDKLPNVTMVALDYFSSSKEWILNSKGVITINGTTAYEAAMLGKKAIMLGTAPFEILEGITKLTDLNQLNKAVAELDKPLENRKSCEAYIQTVLDFGGQVDIHGTKGAMRESIKNNTELPDAAQRTVDNFYKIYETALDILE